MASIAASASALTCAPVASLHHGYPALARMQDSQNRSVTQKGRLSSVKCQPALHTRSWSGIQSSSYQRGLRTAIRKLPSTCAASSNPFTIHLGETSLTIPFTNAAATRLDESIKRILQIFKEKEGQAQRRRLESMEFVDKDKVDVEIICNPNAYANAFQAKVLISVKVGDSVKFSSEGQLSTLRADVSTYLENYGV